MKNIKKINEINNKYVKEKNQLSNFEWYCVLMAIRYVMNRQTIAASTFSADLIKNYYNILTENQKFFALA